ncbi:hypothetical protein GCM10009616_35910 [Microlunatus lacustris]
MSRPSSLGRSCSRHYQRWTKYGDPLGKATPRVLDHEDGTRTCTSCEARLPLEEFDQDSNSALGRRAQCPLCRSSKMKQWYQANQERQRDRQRDRYASNTEAIREQDFQRYLRNKPKRLELAKAGVHKRRAALRLVEFDPTISVDGLRQRDGDLCCFCCIAMSFEVITDHRYNPSRATLEHLLPISRGGSHTWDNVALACWQCNVRKNNRTVEEWTADAQAVRSTP